MTAWAVEFSSLNFKLMGANTTAIRKMMLVHGAGDPLYIIGLSDVPEHLASWPEHSNEFMLVGMYVDVERPAVAGRCAVNGGNAGGDKFLCTRLHHGMIPVCIVRCCRTHITMKERYRIRLRSAYQC